MGVAFETVSERAERFGVDASTIRRQCARGQIPAQKTGGRWLIPRLGTDRDGRRDGGRCDG